MWPDVRVAFGWVAPSGCHPARQAGARHRRGAASLPGPDRGHRPASPGRGPAGRCVRALPEGDAERLAGAVRLLRGRGPTAHQQRPGAVLRLLSLPRAPVQRPEGGLPGDGGAQVSALVAVAATGLRPIAASDLVPSDPKSWRDLRGTLEQRRAIRTLGRRSRRDPAAYLPIA